MSLITIQPLGRIRDGPRLWIESRRLEALGFSHGTPLAIERHSDCLTLRLAILGENHVSSRAVLGGRRPIIDVIRSTDTCITPLHQRSSPQHALPLLSHRLPSLPSLLRQHTSSPLVTSAHRCANPTAPSRNPPRTALCYVSPATLLRFHFPLLLHTGCTFDANKNQLTRRNGK